MQLVDFGQAEEAWRQISNWGSEQTENNVEELLQLPPSPWPARAHSRPSRTSAPYAFCFFWRGEAEHGWRGQGDGHAVRDDGMVRGFPQQMCRHA